MSPRQLDLVNDDEGFFTLLSGQHCRTTLHYLKEKAGEVTSLDDLASHISDGGQEDSRSVAIALHHSTLPRLATAGAIEYDPRSNVIRYSGHPDLEELLDAVSNR